MQNNIDNSMSDQLEIGQSYNYSSVIETNLKDYSQWIICYKY